MNEEANEYSYVDINKSVFEILPGGSFYTEPSLQQFQNTGQYSESFYNRKNYLDETEETVRQKEQIDHTHYEWKRVMGTPLVHGQPFILRHRYSGYYLKVIRTQLANKVMSFKLIINETDSVNSVFTLEPVSPVSDRQALYG